MAEALGIAASVIAVIQITDRVVSLCKLYVEQVRDLPSDIRTILVELSTLKSILENLKFLIECDGISSTLLNGLAGSQGSIEECRRLVTELEALLSAETAQAKKHNKAKLSLAALKWPLKQTKAKKLLEMIMHSKSTITLAITTEASVDIKEIKATAKETQSILSEQQRLEVYKWLVQMDPSLLHRKAQKDFECGTGKWFLRFPEWKRWLDAEESFLWIHGIPGAGKTVLLSYLIEQVKMHCDVQKTDGFVCTYYYCYFGHDQDETESFLRWIINQLCRHKDWVPNSVYNLYKFGDAPHISSLLEGLADVAKRFERIYILIDALDESKARTEVLRLLMIINGDSRFRNVQLLATSREYTDIEGSLSRIAFPISMSNSHNEEDIRLYLHSALQSNAKFCQRWSQDLKDEIERAISVNAKGMFRWAVCQIDLLQRLKPDRETIHRALAKLPQTLYETYDRILNLIPEEDRLVAHHALQWIWYHSQTYGVEGISDVILPQAVEKSVTLATGEGNDRLCDLEYLQEICGCLIRIVHPNGFRVGLISFAHYTVLEYLNLSKSSVASVNCPADFKQSIDILLVETVLYAAHTIGNDHSRVNEDGDQSKELGHKLLTNLGTYSIPRSLIAFTTNLDLLKERKMYHLAVSLIDPSRPGFQVFAATAQRLAFYLGRIKMRTGHPKQMHLLNLLTLLDGTGSDDFLQAFIEEENLGELLTSQVHLHIADFEVEGPLIEVIARVRRFFRAQVFHLLLRCCTGLFDPSRVLLFYIDSHITTRAHDEKDCPIDMLLRLGADPNLSGYPLMALQIAVRNSDLEAVRKLVDAGANVNGVGSPGNELWRFPRFPDNYCNTTIGKTPLAISDYRIRVFARCPNGKRRLNARTIREILHQHGAIKREEVSSDSDSMTSSESET